MFIILNFFQCGATPVIIYFSVVPYAVIHSFRNAQLFNENRAVQLTACGHIRPPKVLLWPSDRYEPFLSLM